MWCVRRKRRPVLGALIVAALVSGLAAGCGGGHGRAAGGATPGASGGCDLGYVTKQIDDHTRVGPWRYPGAPFDAKQAAGKTIFSIQENSTNPFTNTIVAGMKGVAAKVGMRVVDYPNQGQHTQWIQGIQQAISQKADAIVLVGGTIGPIYFSQQAAAAKRACIPIVTVVDRDLTQDAEPDTAARVGQPYAAAARLDADWIIKQTRCKANLLAITSNELIAGDINSKAARDEFDRYCGTGCKVRFVNVPLAQWATRIGTTTQTAVTADPPRNYGFPFYCAIS